MNNRKTVRTLFTKAYQQFEDCIAADDLREAEVNLVRLKQLSDKLEMLNDSVDTTTMDDRALMAEAEKCEEYTVKFNSATLTFRDKKNPVVNSAHGTALITGRDHKPALALPKLTLPNFSGDITLWPQFWESFKLVVHKSKLDDLEKFVYLRSALLGDAKSCICGLSLTSDNYKNAIHMLKEKFGDKQKIIRAHIRNLINLKELNSKTHLSKFIETVQTNVFALNSLSIYAEHYSVMATEIIVSKLTSTMRYEWAKYTDDKGDVNKLLQYLLMENNCREYANDTETVKQGEYSGGSASHESVKGSLKYSSSMLVGANSSSSRNLSKISGGEGYKRANKPVFSKPIATTKSFSENVTPRTPMRCPKCGKEHTLNFCEEFKSLTMENREKCAREHKCCFNCLKPFHSAQECRNTFRCSKCAGKHNTLLHFERKSSAVMISTRNGATETPLKNTTTLLSSEKDTTVSNVTLGTAIALARDKQGTTCKIRLLIDSGSEFTYISSSSLSALNSEFIRVENLHIKGFGELSDGPKGYNKYALQLSRDGDRFYPIEVIATDKLCANLPVIKKGEWPHLNNVMGDLADNYFGNSSRQVDVIVGCDQLHLVLTGRMKVGCPSALETVFGWILLGRTNCREGEVFRSTESLVASGVSVESLLRKFWELDVIGIKDPAYESADCHPCFEKFKVTASRDLNGRYVVQLPWKDDNLDIDTLEHQARLRMLSLVRKFQINPVLFDKLNEILCNYEKKGYICEVTGELSTKMARFMPHQPVVKDEHDTTKIRIVFDASAVDSNNVSVNDFLYEGENLNPNLFGVTLRFRKYPVAILGDVEEAFLQILLCESDKKYVCFYWCDHTGQFKVFRFNRLPFGLKSSPFLLSAVIRHHLSVYFCNETSMRRWFDESIYVDDFVNSTETVETAAQLKATIKQFFADMCMNMRKFQSNVMELNDEEYRGVQNTKVLGMWWDKVSDRLSCKMNAVEVKIGEPITKRQFLKHASSIWDPLGFIQPYTVQAKIIMQKIWNQGLEWDDLLEESILKEALAWLAETKLVNGISLSRYLGEIHSLHAFCDASQLAYAVVVYAYATNGSSTLIACKSRVAPIKTVTIPKLELLAATLGAMFLHTVRIELALDQTEYYLWTDSMVTYHWIKSDARKWKPFVSNRVQSIHDLSEPSRWGYVPGELNPADIASRGMSLTKLEKCENWWQGPPLKGLMLGRTPNIDAQVTAVVDREKKTSTTVCLLGLDQNQVCFERFSSYQRMLYCVAYMCRFIRNCKLQKPERTIGQINALEKQVALNKVILMSQQSEFGVDIQCLSENKPVNKSSLLCTLNPVLDEHGIVRSNSRLGEATELHYNERYPVVLSSDHYFTKLLIRESHERMLHANVRTVMTDLRSNYFVIKARQAIKREIYQCCLCRWKRATCYRTKCADLPAERVTLNQLGQVFVNVGLDYFGPVHLRNKERCYVLLITCTVSRAIHLEPTRTLNRGDFLSAFSRYMSRRGIPSVVYSDNAKTFRSVTETLLSKYNITWKFITERAPWHGGFWERLVGSVKTLLKNVLRAKLCSMEEVWTLLCKVEAVLNSKPLTYVSNDSDEVPPLTPAHFLIGRKLTELPRLSPAEEVRNISLRVVFDGRLKLLKQFRTRWTTQYLRELQQSKYSQNELAKVGDVVLVNDDKSPHLWPTGVIDSICASRDTVPRSVYVKIKGKLYKRPVQKLFRLE